MALKVGLLKMHLNMKHKYINPKQDSIPALDMGIKKISTAKNANAHRSIPLTIFSLVA